MNETVDYKKPLMPMACAVWLIDNTVLTFDQVAAFCGMDSLQVQALADGQTGKGIVGKSPLETGELTAEELKRCESDPAARLLILKSALPPLRRRSKGPRYTPVARRGDKPDAIAYLLKHHPEIPDSQICKLVGTTKPTIKAIRERTHANMSNIKPRHPAELSLCSYRELEEASRKGLKALGKDPDAAESSAGNREVVGESTESGDTSSARSGGFGFDFSNFLAPTGSDAE